MRERWPVRRRIESIASRRERHADWPFERATSRARPYAPRTAHRISPALTDACSEGPVGQPEHAASRPVDRLKANEAASSFTAHPHAPIVKNYENAEMVRQLGNAMAKDAMLQDGRTYLARVNRCIGRRICPLGSGDCGEEQAAGAESTARTGRSVPADSSRPHERPGYGIGVMGDLVSIGPSTVSHWD